MSTQKACDLEITPVLKGLKGPVVIVPTFGTRDLAAAHVCFAERFPLDQR